MISGKSSTEKLKGKAKGIGRRGGGQNTNERECSEEKRNVEETTDRVEISARFFGPESWGGKVVFGEKMRRKERLDKAR